MQARSAIKLHGKIRVIRTGNRGTNGVVDRMGPPAKGSGHGNKSKIAQKRTFDHRVISKTDGNRTQAAP